MRTEVRAPETPTFERTLEDMLRTETIRHRRIRRPYSPVALRRLRGLSSSAGHLGTAVVISTLLLILSPTSLDREAQLPPISEPPVAGYLAQFGVTQATPQQTITMAREAGFEVEVITTFVADRASHGTIVGMRHLAQSVDTVPIQEPVRGPLLIIIGLTVGDSGTVAN